MNIYAAAMIRAIVRVMYRRIFTGEVQSRVKGHAFTPLDEHGRVTGSCFAIVSLATPMMPKHQGSPFDRYFQVELQFTHGHYDIARVIELEI
jgi:hypothetical protein